MYKIMLCDDETALCTALREQLECFAQEIGEEFSISEYHSAEEMLSAITPDTDLLLLDIKMKKTTGMEAARALRSRGLDVCIVFITSMVQYALEGYQVHAFGFLKKPVRYAQLRLQMLDVLQMLSTRQTDRITVRAEGQTRGVDVGSILYLKAQDHMLYMVLPTEQFACSSTLNKMEKLLENKTFFRCHKGYLVNLRHLDKITLDTAIMSDGTEIPVSRHRKKELLDAYARYLGSTSLC